ncbi:MAG: LysR family transcriptional regulator [Deinococcota bacterium]
MKLSQLKAFLITLDCGTFSQAALELNMSQSAVSYAVAELETSLGVTLLQRGRTGATATQIGAEIAVQTRQVFQLTEAIQQLASQETGALRGELNVLTFRSVASRVMPSVLSYLAKHHAGLRVNLVESSTNHAEVEHNLREGRVDVAFVQLPFSDEFIQWEVLRDPYVVVREAQNPKRAVRWRDFQATPLILYGSHESTAVIEQYLKAELGDVKPAYQVEEDSTLIRMVSEGLGLTIMPQLAIDALPNNVETAALPESLTRSIGIAIAPRGLKIPAVRTLINVLKTQYPESKLPNLNAVKQQS